MPYPVEPRWRARVAPKQGWRRWFDRTLAQADVYAPNGDRYLVRISRNVPFVRTPLGPLDSIVPQPVSLAVLITANAYTAGRTGWSVQVLDPPTRWRSDRVIYTRRSRVPSQVIDLAVGTAEAIHRGEQPWETDLMSRRERVFRAMNWD